MDPLDSQRRLLEEARQVYGDTPISEATAAAYLATPRHRFVRRYREWTGKNWHDVTDANLHEHLATLYADQAVILFSDEHDNVLSTISQPSFVLRMLDLLQLQTGHSVLELGAGSGWNAALIGHIVGPAGRVCSLEIIPEMARQAAAIVAEVGLSHVQVMATDGGDGYATHGPYDRIIFTAGTYDLPRAFYDQIAPGGLLLIVIRNDGGRDTLFLLEKVDDHFESRHSMACGFVPMTGRHQRGDLDPALLESLPEWAELRNHEIARRPFPWGGQDRESSLGQTIGIRSFLGMAEPLFRAFKAETFRTEPDARHYFGLWDRENHSLVLAKDDQLLSYGSMAATERLLTHVDRWMELGMPAAADFRLDVYPSDRHLAVNDDQWLVRRHESQFVWSL